MNEIIREPDSDYDEYNEEENIQTFKKLYLTGASLDSDFLRKFSNFYSFSDTFNSILEVIRPIKELTQLVESIKPIIDLKKKFEILKSKEMTEASSEISLEKPETTERAMEYDTELLLDTVHNLSESNERLSETNRKLVEEKIESEKRYQGLKEEIRILNNKLDELTKVRISRFKVPLAWLEEDIQVDDNVNEE